jgi:hypothetical protein
MYDTCRVSLQNKIEKLVHLVVVIRIRLDARSHERKKGDLFVVHPVLFQSSPVLGNYMTAYTN